MASVVELRVGASALPVYDHIDNHAKMYWASSKDQIYWRTQYEPQIRVVALDDYTFGLEFGPVSWPGDLDRGSGAVNAVLQGHFQPEDKSLEGEPCTDDVGIEWNPDETFKCQGKFKSRRTYLPWGFKGKIQWSLVLPSHGDRRVQLAETPVELYFVANAILPPILFRGLPVSFFRRFFLSLRLMAEDDDIKTFNDPGLSRNIGDNEQGWLDYVIDKLHYQPSIQYNSWGTGMNSYFHGADKPFAFDHWVNDCDEKSKHTLNCYDLAALVLVIAPLGLRSSHRRLQMKNMTPFGYINKTHLIGWGPCNSPFTTKGSQVLDINDKDRTGFGTHIFMTMTKEPSDDINGATEMVLDATCRPFDGGHSAKKNLADYIENSIDHKTDLYKTIPDKVAMGKLEAKNPVNWAGPRRLFTQPEIFSSDFIENDATESNILRKVPEMFNGWTTTDSNVRSESTHITAQWFFSSGGEVMTLTIIRCATTGGHRSSAVDSAQALYGADLAKFATNGINITDGDANTDEDVLAVWQSKSGNDLKVDRRSHWSAPSDNDKGAMLWTQGIFFVKLTKDRKEDIAKYAQSIVDLIAVIQKESSPEAPKLQVQGPANTEIPVGETFEVVVSGLPERMVPVDVDIYHAKVLYLSSSKSGDKVTFKFLAREETDDDEPEWIEFSSYTASLTQSEPGDHSVKISVISS